MRKFVTFITILVNIVIAVMVASMAAITMIYAQNTTTIQQTNYSNTTESPMKRLNPGVFIDAINNKIRSIYDGEESSMINSIRH
jgi:MFS superfamily sulfate permease-like transporter